MRRRLISSSDGDDDLALGPAVTQVADRRAGLAQREGPVDRAFPGAAGIPGVIGIVAGRLKERFGRPAIVIAEEADGTGKGSGRSISGVDLGAAVLAAKDSGLLLAGGGHAMAAGLTVAPAGIEPLARLSARADGRGRRASPLAAAPC